jgi:hypothetical protein
MFYILAISAGGVFGLILCAWVRDVPQSYVSHEHCDERFNRMHRRLTHETRMKEEEIQLLIHGDAYIETVVVANDGMSAEVERRRG